MAFAILYYIVTVMQIKLVVVILDWKWLLVAEGDVGGKGDTWMGDLWFAELKANVPKRNREPKLTSARILFHLLFHCSYNLSSMHDG